MDDRLAAGSVDAFADDEATIDELLIIRDLGPLPVANYLLGRLAPVDSVLAEGETASASGVPGSRILIQTPSASHIAAYDVTGENLQFVSNPGSAYWTVGLRVRDNATEDDYRYDGEKFIKLPPDKIPRIPYTADGAISDEDQKAVFYSDTALAMTVNSATDRQIVLILSLIHI